MDANTHFETIITKYSNYKDKVDSLYIFVIYKINLEDLSEKITKLISNIDTMNDNKKKSYLKNRLNNFREYLKLNNKPETIINGIFMISENIYMEDLIPYYLQTLNMFEHKKISYQYGSEYPLEWLKDLLLDREFINVIKVKNNDITHTKINSTKKINVYTNTIKSMDLKKIILERVPKGEPYLIHGVSVSLKNFVDKNAISVNTTELTEEAILKIMSNIKNIQYHNELTDIFNKLLDPKIETKITFGKDIQTCIKSSLLKTLYCTETIQKKLSTIPDHYKNFEIKVVKLIEKGDISDKLEKDYGGAIGIKYY
jgi:hypothetical protein